MAATKTTKKRPPEGKSAEVRLVVRIPANVHRALKIRAATDGVTIRQFILDALKDRGVG